MYYLALGWAMIFIVLMMTFALGLRLMWEVGKLALVIGFAGVVLVVMGVI